MPARLSIRRRVRGTQYQLHLSGELDGSTACQALDAVARAPAHARELVLDLAEVTRLHPFGVEVLSRGVRSRARGRPVRLVSMALVTP